MGNTYVAPASYVAAAVASHTAPRVLDEDGEPRR